MAWVNIIDLFWPVGSIYWAYNENNTNDPVTLFGGQWALIGTTTVNGVTLKAWERTS